MISKVTGCKNNIQKFVALLYSNDELSEREIKKTIPLNIASKRIKYLGINLPKEVKDLNSENYKTLMKETEDDKQIKRYAMGTSMVVQWLRLCAPNAGGPSLIPGLGTRSHMHATTKEPVSCN